MDLLLHSDFKLIQLDINSLETLYRFHVEHFPQYQYSKKSFKFFLCENSYKTFAITKDKNILSYIIFSYIVDESDIIFLGTHLDYQRLGLASTLIQIPHHLFKVNKIFLEVSTENANAIGFYSKHNFKILSVRKNYFAISMQNNSDAYLMCQVY